MRRYPLGIWAGIVFSLALCASALYWDASRVSFSPDSVWATGEQLDAEYHKAQSRLDLPEGVEWPEAPPFPAMAPDGARYSYGAGLGTEYAEWCWFDAWARCAVSASEPTATRSVAVERLPDFYEMTAFESATTSEYFTRVIAAAQNGDLTGLREYVDSVESAKSATVTEE
ncbi:MAG: hypothetical protein ACYC6C_05200 [Coriobacteriia bacterium]